MATIAGQCFDSGEKVVVDGNTFINCLFRNCELVGDLPSFQDRCYGGVFIGQAGKQMMPVQEARNLVRRARR